MLIRRTVAEHFGHLMQRANSLEKTHVGKGGRQKENGVSEDEMVR